MVTSMKRARLGQRRQQAAEAKRPVLYLSKPLGFLARSKASRSFELSRCRGECLQHRLLVIVAFASSPSGLC